MITLKMNMMTLDVEPIRLIIFSNDSSREYEYEDMYHQTMNDSNNCNSLQNVFMSYDIVDYFLYFFNIVFI